MEMEQTGSHMHRRIEGQAHLLLLSAHDQPTLLKTTEMIERHCNSTNVFDLAYTLAIRREEHQARTFAVCREADRSSSSEFAAENIVTSAATTNVAFAFTGTSLPNFGVLFDLFHRTRSSVGPHGKPSLTHIPKFPTDYSSSRRVSPPDERSAKLEY
jgi:hypothetical protein